MEYVANSNYENLVINVTKDKKKDNKIMFSKFSASDWGDIERNFLNPEQLMVCNAMCKLGNPLLEGQTISNNYVSCGDRLYVKTVRPCLVKFNMLPAKNIIIQDNQKKLKKADLIREQNTTSSLTNEVKKLIKYFINDLNPKRESNFELTKSVGFTSNYIESRLITFIHCCNYYINCKSTYEQTYELIIGIKKAIENIKSIDNISEHCLQDLELKCDELINFCSYSVLKLCEKYPKFVISTDYGQIFPALSIKPYASQTELMEIVKKMDKYFVFYMATIGSGKTTFSIALSKHVEFVRNTTENKSLQLLFVCSVEPVRKQVCRMAYNINLPFGVSTIDKSGNVILRNHFSCRNDESRILIVTDINSAIELLKKDQNYIMFLDEPTVGADQSGDPITNAVAKLMCVAPKQTILSSATLPAQDEILDIINYMKNKYNGLEVVSVCSKESLIGCEILSFDGHTILPQNNCESCMDLSFVIDKLENKLFIDRMYTAPVLYRLLKRIKNCINLLGNMKMDVTNLVLPNLEEYFSDINNLSQYNIQKMAIQLLHNVVSTHNDKMVEEICKPLINKIYVDPEPEDEMNESDEDEQIDVGFDFDWESEESENSKNSIDSDEIVIDYGNNKEEFILDEHIRKFENLFSKDAYKYLGSCLIAVENPLKFATDLSYDYFKNIPLASKFINRYEKQLQAYKKHLERLEQIETDPERTEEVEKIKSIPEPKLEFPDCLRINTPDHIKQFVSKKIITKLNKKMIQHYIQIENLDLDMNIPDQVYLLLFAGVGIYAPLDNKLDPKYNNLVLSLAAEGCLAFLISDASICYGANYPLSHVIITDKLANKHSMGTIFQLAGRSGRVGKSYTAYVHMENQTIERMINYLRGIENDGISEEAINMTNEFNAVLDELHAINEEKNLKLIPIKKIKEVKQKIKQQEKDVLEVSRKDIRKKRNKNNNNTYGFKPTSKPTSKTKKTNSVNSNLQNNNNSNNINQDNKNTNSNKNRNSDRNWNNNNNNNNNGYSNINQNNRNTNSNRNWNNNDDNNNNRYSNKNQNNRNTNSDKNWNNNYNRNSNINQDNRNRNTNSDRNWNNNYNRNSNINQDNRNRNTNSDRNWNNNRNQDNRNRNRNTNSNSDRNWNNNYNNYNNSNSNNNRNPTRNSNMNRDNENINSNENRNVRFQNNTNRNSYPSADEKPIRNAWDPRIKHT